MSKRGAGICIPLFSLRSKRSCGNGEFYDLIPLIDWAKEAGLSLIQILPINDTTMTGDESDRSPYAIFSAFALHPIYLNLLELAPDLEDELHECAAYLRGPNWHYQETYATKIRFLRQIFDQRGEKDMQTTAFQTFVEKTKDDLVPYVAFSLLRDRLQTNDFREWGEYENFSMEKAQEVCSSAESRYYFFVQFHLHKQLKEVKAYAKKAGIRLMGDFPVGVDSRSVEAWRFQGCFRWDKTIGAPPDFYNSLGQNWGFPAYDWDVIRGQKYAWLTSRLQWMEQYFDVVRLDHVLGYFRLWELPIDEVRGLMGNFFPSIPLSREDILSFGLEPEDPSEFSHQVDVVGDDLYTEIENRLFLPDREKVGMFHPRVDGKSTRAFAQLTSKQQNTYLHLSDDYFLHRQDPIWEKEGREKLGVILKATKMEICAEDIGVIPTCVGTVLNDLHILNTHIQRMPKNFDIEYEKPEEFPEGCFSTPSNHDTPTLRQWWEEDPDSTQRYYHDILGHAGNAPKELTPEIAEEIIQEHIDTKSRWVTFLLQDFLALSIEIQSPRFDHERINDPAHADLSWHWRMPLYVEELILAKSFTKKIRSMVEKGKR